MLLELGGAYSQDLNPICGPERMDWCDSKRLKQLKAWRQA